MSILCLSRRQMLAMVGAAAVAQPFSALAQTVEPAEMIRAFYATLLECMQNGAQLGFDGRYEKIEPVLNNTFDVITMSKIAVGPEWTKMSGDEKGAVLVTFNKYMVTTYAARFKEYKNQKFEVGDTKPSGDGRVLVESKLIRANGEPVSLNYLFRLNKDVWRVIDVYLSGSISQMAQMRSDFSKTVTESGPDALIKSLEQKIEDLKQEA